MTFFTIGMALEPEAALGRGDRPAGPGVRRQPLRLHHLDRPGRSRGSSSTGPSRRPYREPREIGSPTATTTPAATSPRSRPSSRRSLRAAPAGREEADRRQPDPGRDPARPPALGQRPVLPDRCVSVRPINQAGWFAMTRTRRFAAFVPEGLRRTGGDNPAHRGFAPGASGRGRRAAHRLCRYLQLSAPRCASNPGGPAARQRSRHPPLPGGSRHRGDDARRHPRDGHQPELPGVECRRDPALFRQRDRSGGRRQGGNGQRLRHRPGRRATGRCSTPFARAVRVPPS